MALRAPHQPPEEDEDLITSSCEDLYNYSSYDLEQYTIFEGPPLIKKTSRLIAAVVQNQVDVLRDLLDSPKWYKVIDDGTYSLLQIAILRNNKEIFDYMMSIPDFPINYVNAEDHSALVIALCECDRENVWLSEHFAYELLKKGACVPELCCRDFTPLQCAFKRSYFSAAKLIMETGVGLNVPDIEGNTPLDQAILMTENTTELVTALLSYGAEYTFEHFVDSVMNSTPLLVQETLFLYVYDEYSELEIDLDVFLELARERSHWFHRLLKIQFKLICIEENVYPYFWALCALSLDYLKIVIEKFGHHLNRLFAKTERIFYMDPSDQDFYIENVSVMFESSIKYGLITFVTVLSGRKLFKDLVRCGYGQSITEVFCLLLSYGLNINEDDLQLVYRKLGYCELFKILLHMDIKRDLRDKHKKDIMPVFIYDVTMNLEKFFIFPYDYTSTMGGLDKLFSYFAHPKLSDHIVSRKKMPQIPLLLELSRNAFRKFFIKKYEITTSRKFFTLLNCLPICPAHKKIITYETKLY